MASLFPQRVLWWVRAPSFHFASLCSLLCDSGIAKATVRVPSEVVAVAGAAQIPCCRQAKVRGPAAGDAPCESVDRQIPAKVVSEGPQ